ncbi:MAG: cupin domain-containing protein [Saprospiraceae bacterium]|nr:cupin domain-containing protein [Saprospiraceae bacterium]
MTQSISKVNLDQKLSLFSDYFNPRIVGELNNQQVKLVKFQGEFVWHKHDHEDELFLVIHGSFTMELRDQSIELYPGEMLVVPRGVEHRPVAEHEVSVLLFEPATTLNTGDASSELTKVVLEKSELKERHPDPCPAT